MKQVIKYAALIFALILAASIIGGCLSAGVVLVRNIADKTGDLSIEKTDNALWSWEEDGTLVFHLGKKTISTGSGEVKSGTESFADYDITSMDIDVVSCDIIVEPWDNEYVSVEYQNIPVEYRIYEEGGILKIEVTDNINFIWNNFTEKQEIRVYAPASVTYEKLDLEKTSGSSKITGMKVTELKVESVSGSTNISGITAEKSALKSTSGSVTVKDCALGDASLDSTSGTINFENVSAKNLVLDTTSGRVNYSGTLTGNSVFESTSGAINVVLDGKEEDYDLRVDMGSGSFYLNGKKENDNHIEHDGARNVIVFDAGSGRVSVDFQETSGETGETGENYDR